MKHIKVDELTLIKIPKKNISSDFVSAIATHVTLVNSVTSRQKGTPTIQTPK
jgi:hypothetical protein